MIIIVVVTIVVPITIVIGLVSIPIGAATLIAASTVPLASLVATALIAASAGIALATTASTESRVVRIVEAMVSCVSVAMVGTHLLSTIIVDLAQVWFTIGCFITTATAFAASSLEASAAAFAAVALLVRVVVFVILALSLFAELGRFHLLIMLLEFHEINNIIELCSCGESVSCKLVIHYMTWMKRFEDDLELGAVSGFWNHAIQTISIAHECFHSVLVV